MCMYVYVCVDKDNNSLPEDKASEQRALMFEQCGEERLNVENELKVKKELLELHIQSRKRMGVKLTKGDVDVCMYAFVCMQHIYMNTCERKFRSSVLLKCSVKYIYIHTYIHTYLHTYIHSHTCIRTV